MFAGFGTAEETNHASNTCSTRGRPGLSIAFDLPTLMGYDFDAPEALGEFGKCGVAVSSLKDMESCWQGIPLDKVSTSMTINSPAAIIWAMYIAAAEKQGVKPDQLRGTTQNDILKEYIAQKEYIFPPEPSMRLVVDTIEFGTNDRARNGTPSASPATISARPARPPPRSWLSPWPTGWNTCAGRLNAGWTSTALPRACRSSSMPTTTSSRRSPSTALPGASGRTRCATPSRPRQERSWLMRFHTQTAGVSLTAQQPEINIVRVAIQALGGGAGWHAIAAHQQHG